ncbi:PilZ domain-containing protein [Pseudobacteriovorax antillogorgiicola]|uniref:PilZ domain-containing protein n=1 Tax=Pseudobacteriovorax antillogorgiicola TaxID=1513793 RepID=A0A1Y6CNJ2_9BACT|nr:PilZ domain-containing protein [Pseudobacteriovorax antillogorgiicola]TCS44975.1 PilZ domain-containing protein [Pseudobacteriovorax antillogorgiicola]SMF76766.1 PilZ domain-containing protein [Pseudobacteriovorax antillogorgiicola]
MRPKEKSGKERRLKPRFKISLHVRIEAQLIGSHYKYDFITEDLSETGLLIRHTGKGRVSFNELSIIEVWLYPPKLDPLFFYAKFVRFQKDDQCMAIRIIDIEPEAFRTYHDFIMAHASEEVVYK